MTPIIDEALMTAHRAEHVSEWLLDGEVVIYDPAHERMHVLNATAAFVWHLCDGAHHERDIIEALAERYPDSYQQIEADVPMVLQLFRVEGLVQL